eukprot:UN29903
MDQEETDEEYYSEREVTIDLNKGEKCHTEIKVDKLVDDFILKLNKSVPVAVIGNPPDSAVTIEKESTIAMTYSNIILLFDIESQKMKRGLIGHKFHQCFLNRQFLTPDLLVSHSFDT